MATFKSKMKHLDPEWADKIWIKAHENAVANPQKSPELIACIAALALTGARPASLERGIVFSLNRSDKNNVFIEAKIPGAKLVYEDEEKTILKRGQEEVSIRWSLSNPELPPRKQELAYIAEMLKLNGRPVKIKMGVDAIAKRVASLSKQIWPRKVYHVSPICYRELFSANGKAAGIDPVELAAAMGHLSTESQGRYASPRKRTSGAVAPPKVNRIFTSAKASGEVKTHRTESERFPKVQSLAKFKAANSFKTKLKSLSPKPH
jgi:hypothetical protein